MLGGNVNGGVQFGTDFFEKGVQRIKKGAAHVPVIMLTFQVHGVCVGQHKLKRFLFCSLDILGLLWGALSSWLLRSHEASDI